MTQDKEMEAMEKVESAESAETLRVQRRIDEVNRELATPDLFTAISPPSAGQSIPLPMSNAALFALAANAQVTTRTRRTQCTYLSTAAARAVATFGNMQVHAARFLTRVIAKEHPAAFGRDGLRGDSTIPFQYVLARRLYVLDGAVICLPSPSQFRGTKHFYNSAAPYTAMLQAFNIRIDWLMANFKSMHLDWKIGTPLAPVNFGSTPELLTLHPRPDEAYEGLGNAIASDELAHDDPFYAYLVLCAWLVVEGSVTPMTSLTFAANDRALPQYFGRGIIHQLNREFPAGAKEWEVLSMSAEEKASLQQDRQRERMRTLRAQRREELESQAVQNANATQGDSLLAARCDELVMQFESYGIHILPDFAPAYAKLVLSKRINITQLREMKDRIIEAKHWDHNAESVFSKVPTTLHPLQTKTAPPQFDSPKAESIPAKDSAQSRVEKRQKAESRKQQMRDIINDSVKDAFNNSNED